MRFVFQCFVIVLAVLGAAPLAHSEQIFGDFGQPAWSRMFKYFESRFGAIAKDEMVQVLPIATNAAWDDPISTLRLVEMHRWGDWAPSNAWQYAPNSGRRISEGYQYFLNAAWVAAVDANGTASAELKNALKRASEEVQFTRAEYISKQDEALRAYGQYVNNTPPSKRRSKTEFYSNPPRGYGWAAEIDISARRLDKALETLEIVTKNLNDPDIELLKRAQIKFNNPKQKITLPPIREVLNDPERWQPYFISYVDKDIFAFLKEKNRQSQKIEEVSQTSTYFEQKWKASVSVSFLGLFRAGGASAEQIRRETHVKNHATRIEVSFANVDTFNIVRGEWFDENLVSRFAPKLKSDAFDAVWGSNGQLELIPKTLMVGRGMTFRIYADSDSLDYLYDHFEGGADAGIYIGYWRVGGSGEYSSTRSETKVYKFKDYIEFTDLSGRGKVLAVLAKHYAAGLTRPKFTFAATDDAHRDARKTIDALWSPSVSTQKIQEILGTE